MATARPDDSRRAGHGADTDRDVLASRLCVVPARPDISMCTFGARAASGASAREPESSEIDSETPE